MPACATSSIRGSHCTGVVCTYHTASSLLLDPCHPPITCPGLPRSPCLHKGQNDLQGSWCSRTRPLPPSAHTPGRGAGVLGLCTPAKTPITNIQLCQQLCHKTSIPALVLASTSSMKPQGSPSPTVIPRQPCSFLDILEIPAKAFPAIL
mgnify:CR=1 FL=1